MLCLHHSMHCNYQCLPMKQNALYSIVAQCMLLTLHNTACNSVYQFPHSGAVQLQEVMCMVTVADHGDVCIVKSVIITHHPSETTFIADHDCILNQNYQFICYKIVPCSVVELLAYARRVLVQNKTTTNANRNCPITQLFYFKPVCTYIC